MSMFFFRKKKVIYYWIDLFGLRTTIQIQNFPFSNPNTESEGEPSLGQYNYIKIQIGANGWAQDFDSGPIISLHIKIQPMKWGQSR